MAWPRFEPVLEVLRGGPRTHDGLSQWIEGRYGIPVIDVVDDPMGDDLGPRLSVWLRTEEQAGTFRRGANFDDEKQRAIAEAAGRPHDLVIFCAADKVLRERALAAVPEADYTAAARAVIDDGAAIWKVYPLFGGLFVWVHTDAQVAAVRDSGEFERIVDALWTLVSPRDEFGMLDRDRLRVALDSRQNLDENFQGNSYYYHR